MTVEERSPRSELVISGYERLVSIGPELDLLVVPLWREILPRNPDYRLSLTRLSPCCGAYLKATYIMQRFMPGIDPEHPLVWRCDSCRGDQPTPAGPVTNWWPRGEVFLEQIFSHALNNTMWGQLAALEMADFLNGRMVAWLREDRLELQAHLYEVSTGQAPHRGGAFQT